MTHGFVAALKHLRTEVVESSASQLLWPLLGDFVRLSHHRAYAVHRVWQPHDEDECP